MFVGTKVAVDVFVADAVGGDSVFVGRLSVSVGGIGVLPGVICVSLSVGKDLTRFSVGFGVLVGGSAATRTGVFFTTSRAAGVISSCPAS